MNERVLPPLNWLRAFETSARHLSFTQAASELNLTQAAVSKQVKLLEQHLNQQLFVRHARHLGLTKTAEAYLPKVNDAFERLTAGTREVFGRQTSEILTVRAGVSFAVNWLAPRLPGYFAQHPKRPLRLISSVWNEAFDEQRFDLDIQYGRGIWKGHKSKQLTFETITPVCAPQVAGQLRAVDDLNQHTLLHVLGYQEGWGAWLRAAGAKHLDAGQGVQADTSLMAFQLAKLGHGIALGRSSLVEQDLKRGALVAPFDLRLPVEEAFYVLFPVSGTAHPDADLFVNWLQSVC